METSTVHCPKCGSPQTSGDQRFCRACGLSLSGVLELVVPGKVAIKADRARFRSAMRQGMILLILCLLAAVCLTLLNDLGLVPQMYVKFISAGFLVAAMARMFYPYVVPGRRMEQHSEPQGLDSGFETGRLTNASHEHHAGTAANFPAPREFAPASVTEHTTRSLGDHAD